MEKSFLAAALIFLCVACSAKNTESEPFSELDYKGSSVQTIVLKAKKKKVSDIDSLVKEIEEANLTAQVEEDKEGNVRLKIPHVLFKPSIDLHYSDWGKITAALQKAKSLRVSLDFSLCKMADDKSEKDFRRIPYISLSDNISLYEIRFPEGLISYANGVCYDCKNLRSVYFPKNGFGSLSDGWKYSMPKDISLIFDDDSDNAFHYTLSDDPFDAQMVSVEKFEKPYSKIALVIESVYPGSEKPDCCAIDELCVNSWIFDQRSSGEEGEARDYLYDPETIQMFVELLSMDVGRENVQASDDGKILARVYDEGMGEYYWTNAGKKLFGEFYDANNPGTGAGGSCYEYSIRLNSSGEHYLFVWHNIHDSIFRIYPQNLKVYLWKNKEWKLQTEQSHVKGLDAIFTCLSFLEGRGFASEFYDKQLSYSDDGLSISAFPTPTMRLPVTFDFSYDIHSGTFVQEKNNLYAELAFGSRKGLQALGDIKALYEKEKFYGFTPSIFAYPAAYNTDPDVVDYLKELGFSAKEDEPDDDYRDRFTVLEAWQAGKNSKAVRDALLKAGASYSGKMLEAAFESGDLEKVKELTPLVLDKVPMLADVIYYYDTHSEQESCLPYIRDCLKCLKENGTDLNQKFDWEKYAGVCLMEFALNEANYDLILLYQSLGVEIPKKLGRFELLGMSDPMGCVAYNFNDYCREDDPNHPRAMDAVKLLDYLLQKGYDINEADERGKTLLQRCCTSVYYNDVEFAKILLKRGADVNLKNAEGDTPLAILIKDSDFNEWSVKLLELLVANGADTSVLKDLPDEAREVLEHSGYNVKYDSMNNSYKLEK